MLLKNNIWSLVLWIICITLKRLVVMFIRLQQLILGYMNLFSLLFFFGTGYTEKFSMSCGVFLRARKNCRRVQNLIDFRGS